MANTAGKRFLVTVKPVANGTTISTNSNVPSLNGAFVTPDPFRDLNFIFTGQATDSYYSCMCMLFAAMKDGKDLSTVEAALVALADP